ATRPLCFDARRLYARSENATCVNPGEGNTEIARRAGCCVHTVTHWRQCGLPTNRVREAPRAGTRRTFTPLQRAPLTALACPRPWQILAAVVGGGTCPGRQCAAERGAPRAGDGAHLAVAGPAQTRSVSRVPTFDRAAVGGQGQPRTRPLQICTGVGGAGR